MVRINVSEPTNRSTVHPLLTVHGSCEDHGGDWRVRCRITFPATDTQLTQETDVGSKGAWRIARWKLPRCGEAILDALLLRPEAGGYKVASSMRVRFEVAGEAVGVT